MRRSEAELKRDPWTGRNKQTIWLVACERKPHLFEVRKLGYLNPILFRLHFWSETARSQGQQLASRLINTRSSKNIYTIVSLS